MNITLTIEAPELVGAIEALAASLGNVNPLPATLAPVKETPKKEVAVPVNDEAEKTAALESELKAAALEAKKTAAAEKAAKAKKAAELAAKAEAEAAVAEEEEKTEPGISLEFVRGKLAEFAAQGKQQQVEVRDALSRFGVKKLTEVNPEDYADLLELLEISE